MSANTLAMGEIVAVGEGVASGVTIGGLRPFYESEPIAIGSRMIPAHCIILGSSEFMNCNHPLYCEPFSFHTSASHFCVHDPKTKQVMDLVNEIRHMKKELDHLRPIARRIREESATKIQRWWRGRWDSPHGFEFRKAQLSFKRRTLDNMSTTVKIN